MANPNEGAYSASNFKKNYYGIDGEGRLFRNATDEEKARGGKDIVSHVKTKGAKAGEIVIRKTVPNIYGVVSGFWLHSSEFEGKVIETLILELYDNGFKAVLQMPMDSSFAEDVIRKINNIKEGVKYEVQSWKMQATDQVTKKAIADKFIRGVSIKDPVGNKIEKYINKDVQLKMLPLESCQLFDSSTERQSKDFWKMYFMLITNQFKTRVIPKNKERFEEWAKVNISDEPVETAKPEVKQQESQDFHNALYDAPVVTTTPSVFHESDESKSFPSLADEPPIIDNDLPF